MALTPFANRARARTDILMAACFQSLEHVEQTHSASCGAVVMDDLDMSPLPTGPRVRWIYATVLVFSVFFIWMAGVGFAGIGPCGAANPIALLVSALISAAALFAALFLLTERQRRFRLRTVPFYLIVVTAVLFVVLQTLLFILFA
jgi:hypothetical protein